MYMYIPTPQSSTCVASCSVRMIKFALAFIVFRMEQYIGLFYLSFVIVQFTSGWFIFNFLLSSQSSCRRSNLSLMYIERFYLLFITFQFIGFFSVFNTFYDNVSFYQNKITKKLKKLCDVRFQTILLCSVHLQTSRKQGTKESFMIGSFLWLRTPIRDENSVVWVNDIGKQFRLQFH